MGTTCAWLTTSQIAADFAAEQRTIDFAAMISTGSPAINDGFCYDLQVTDSRTLAIINSLLPNLVLI